MTPPLIAVVDDDPLVHKLMNLLLTAEGYRTILWSESQTAYDMIRRVSPALVLLDLYMQGDRDTGLKVLELLKADHTTIHIPVIIISGVADAGLEQSRRLRILAYARLVKPVAFDTLLNLIAAALRQVSARSAALSD